MKTKKRNRRLVSLLAAAMLVSQITGICVNAEEAAPQAAAVKIVLTLGADLDADQQAYILQYFGIDGTEVETVTITNEDEHAQLGSLIPAEVIGSRTVSCALVRPTHKGGIQVKTANMNYVTSNMIASTLSTSGVYNCEVLTAAPFEVSGTGALTGVMMAYEKASGTALDSEKKELANEELVITGELSETVGQDQATLVVNDIKIHIVRDSVTDQKEIQNIVDEVVETTEYAAAIAAEAVGRPAPSPLGEVHKEKLYNFGCKFSQQGYSYRDMQPTLERVTHNITTNTGIDDPITDTFETIDEDTGLSLDSILLGTDDSVMGDDANINATNTVALGEHPAEPIEVFTGEVSLTESGTVKADSFIYRTNTIAYQDINGSYALMDLNGNILTESIYSNEFIGKEGHIRGSLNDGSKKEGLLETDGMISVPFVYDVVEVFGEMWAAGLRLIPATEADYDYSRYVNGGEQYLQIDSADIYYLGELTGTPAASLTREQILQVEALGSYINIQDRSGAVTTYDSAMAPVRTSDSLYDFGEFDEDKQLSERMESATGYSVYSYLGNYAHARDYSTGKSGVIDRYGNVIVPMEYDYVDSAADWLEGNGYFGVQIGEQFAYVTAGGTVTGEFPYPYEKVINYGMSAKYEAEDGTKYILSGDGVESNLGTAYEYLTPIRSSKGMLWIGTGESGYDLIDWHGKVLLSCSKEFSLSENGNYLIAPEGYTSSTFYLVNDASPVSISESVGGAAEIQAATREIGSMEAYRGEPSLELAGETPGQYFVEGTDLLQKHGEAGLALFSLDGRQLTEYGYSRFGYSDGWIMAVAKEKDTEKMGLFTKDGLQVLPCENDYLDILSDKWAVSYTMGESGTEEDYDFYTWSGERYKMDTATVYYLDLPDIYSVTLTRDQLGDIDADGDYLNITDRTTGITTMYSASFEPVGSVDYVSDFSGVSADYVLMEQLEDQTGYYVSDWKFSDGYALISSYEEEKNRYGVSDTEGNIVVPVQYDRVLAYYTQEDSAYWANGYFAVEKDGMAGFVGKDGTVTCELNYPSDTFSNNGMTACVEKEDGSRFLVAADGKETGGYENYRSLDGRGMFVEAVSGNERVVLDWHGNVLFEDYELISASWDGKFIVVNRDFNSPSEVYAVDGASVEEAVAAEAAVTEMVKETAAPAETETEAENPAAEAPVTERASTEETSAEPPAAEETEAETPTAEIPAAEVPEKVQATEEASPDGAAADSCSEAAEGASASPAESLLSSILLLLEQDLEGNQANIVELLKSVKTMLDAENPEAAVLIGSAITLMQAEPEDASAAVTLINSALSLM